MSKSATDAVLKLTTIDGKPVYLEPGTTWIELVPNSTGGWSAS
jgi:hypothetical protein